MTLMGILESLVATAIWAVLVIVVIRTKNHFRDEVKKNRKKFEWVTNCITNEMVISIKHDIYFFISVFLGRLQRNLNRQKQVRFRALLFMSASLYWGSKAPGGYEIVIILIFYLPLIAFESYEIWKNSSVINELESAILEGSLCMIENLYKTDKKIDKSHSSPQGAPLKMPQI